MNHPASAVGLGRTNTQGQKTTPTNARRSTGPGKRRRICLSEVANQVAVHQYANPPSHHNTSSPTVPVTNRGVYQPNQSLYSGHYEQNFSEDSDDGQENNLQHSNSLPSGPTSSEIVVMLQEQQHLLEKLLQTQKEMQEKQEDLEVKLQELKKLSESSSSSPNYSQGRKFKISRNLTVI